MINKKVKKGLLITAATIIIVVVLVIAFISPIAKYLIEKYDVKYLGREIKISWLYLNPFTGYIHIHGLKVYEPLSDSTILVADGLTAKYEVLKTFKKTYEISSITLIRPVGYIIQDHKTFNFSDLIDRFTPKEKRDTTLPHHPVHFNILGIAIQDGEFHYIERNIPINYFVKHVNIESTGKSWDVDSMNIKFELQSGPGSGIIKGKTSINFDNLRYRLAVAIDKFDLKILEQYLHDITNYSNLSATLDLNMKAEGSLTNQLDLVASGIVSVSDLHFGKSPGEDFLAFDRLVLDATEIDPKEFEYIIDSFTIRHPFFKYERYDHLDNLQMMFGKGGEKITAVQNDNTKFNLIIEIGKYVKTLAMNFVQSQYTVGKLALYNGDVLYNDFTLREKFSAEASPLFLRADSIDKKYNRISAAITTGIKPYGALSGSLSIDPKDYGNFDLRYKLWNLPVSMFNPFVVSYTSFPLDRGRVDFNGYMTVADSNIVSENHLVVLDPRVAKRIKKKDTKWIPIPFIMSLVRSSGNAIDFSIPIRGNLNSPKFKFWPIIGQVLTNIIVKPPSSGYLITVKTVEKEVEKSLTLQWQMHQVELSPNQDKFVDKMATFLRDNKDATLTVAPKVYTAKEKEHILLYEAKKKYFLDSRKITAHVLNEEDSDLVEKMSVKDSGFVHYLNAIGNNKKMNTIQEKCENLIGKPAVDAKFHQLLKDRMVVFKAYFGADSARIKFKTEETVIPFNGFSYYLIDYNGDVPEKLSKAYDHLEKLDNQPPREKYKDKRKARMDALDAKSEKSK